MASKISRRELLRWGAVGTGALTLAACAPRQPEPAPAPVEEKPEEEAPPAPPTETGRLEYDAWTGKRLDPQPASNGPIELRYLTRQGDMGSHMREFAQRFQDESEGRVVVETEEVPWGEVPVVLETQLISDTMVDVTWGDTAWWPYLAMRGAFLVIEPFVEAADLDVDNWFNLEWFRKWTDGKLSGLGSDSGINHIVCWYNREWVLEAWGKEPDDDWTMDDYVECMKACVELKGPGHFGGNAPIGGNHVCDGWIRNWGGFYINPEGTQSLFAEEKCQDGIRFLREQLANGNYPGREDREEGEMQMFLAGKQATYISNPGAAQGMHAGSAEHGIDLGEILAPKGPSAFETPPRRAFIPYANTTGVYSKTKHPQEAFDLMLRVTSNECQKWLTMETGKQPGSQLDLWYDPDVVERFPIFPKVADLMRECTDAFSMPANARYNEWVDIGANEIPPLVFGEVEYNQANIDQVNDHLQEIIDLPVPGRMFAE